MGILGSSDAASWIRPRNTPVQGGQGLVMEFETSRYYPELYKVARPCMKERPRLDDGRGSATEWYYRRPGSYVQARAKRRFVHKKIGGDVVLAA